MSYSLKQVLMERDGMTGIEADQDIKEKRKTELQALLEEKFAMPFIAKLILAPTEV